MARQRKGKKGLHVRRQPNGRPEEKTKKHIAASMIDVVMAQPHRLGDQNQMRENIAGRFCLLWKASKMPYSIDADKFYHAAMEYEATVRRWRAAKGVPTNVRLGGGSGVEPSPETVQRWQDRIDEADRAMALAGGVKAVYAVKNLVVEGYDIPLAEYRSARIGLVALAKCFGWVAKGDLCAKVA